MFNNPKKPKKTDEKETSYIRMLRIMTGRHPFLKNPEPHKIDVTENSPRPSKKK